MKILITTGIYPPDIGGPATYSKLLNDELSKRGLEIKVLNFGEVRHLPKIIRHIVYFWKTLKLGYHSDVIFAQDPVSVGLPSCLAAKILRKKFVLKIVGDYAWEQGNQRFGVKDLLDDFLDKKYCRQVEFLRKIQKFVAQRANVIITPSEYLKKIISLWGVNKEKIEVIYNAFDAPEIIISREEARRKLNLSGFILISAGRLVPWKGFSVLIEIMQEILKEIPEAKLIIIGDGPEKENLKFKIRNLKLENNIRLTDKITREEILIYLQAGDIFILNTAYEGLSHQLLEAMALGIPIITTKAGGNPEIIESEKSGLLIDYNDGEQLKEAIIELCRNQELKNQFIKNAREKVEEFNKEKMIKETIKVLLS